MDNQIKKTVRLNGHTTSLALEKEFWKELNIIASNQSLSLNELVEKIDTCLLYTSPSPRDRTRSRMPSSA